MAVLTAALVMVSGWVGSTVRPCDISTHGKQARENRPICASLWAGIFLKANRRIERALLMHEAPRASAAFHTF